MTAADWERAAEEKLDPGAFGYIAGGAGAEETMRANLDAFRQLAHPAAHADRATHAATSPSTCSGCTRRRRSCSRRSASSRSPTRRPRSGSRRRPRRRACRSSLSSAATHSLEEVAATNAPRWFQLYWVSRPRDLRELRQARRGRRLRRDRRHARHADARLAATRPAARLPAVPEGRRLRAVLHRPGLPLAARQAARGGPADRRRDDARDVPEHRPDVGRPRLAARADDAADPRQGRADRGRRAARAAARRRRRDRLEPRRPAGRRRRRGTRRARRGARRAARRGRADGRRHPHAPPTC